MQRIFALALAAIILLALAACNETAENNAPQNDPSESINAPRTETTPKESLPSGANMNEGTKSGDYTEISSKPGSIPLPPSAPEPAPAPQHNAKPSAKGKKEDDAITHITITVGDKVFGAALFDNSAAKALLAQFPMTLDMSDLNGNEKYYYLTDDLPSNSTESPAAINAGDLMCWSGNCLVLFYKAFSNSYGGYVRLGYVDDTPGLAAALGSGSVQVMFAAGN